MELEIGVEQVAGQPCHGRQTDTATAMAVSDAQIEQWAVYVEIVEIERTDQPDRFGVGPYPERSDVVTGQADMCCLVVREVWRPVKWLLIRSQELDDRLGVVRQDHRIERQRHPASIARACTAVRPLSSSTIRTHARPPTLSTSPIAGPRRQGK